MQVAAGITAVVPALRGVLDRPGRPVTLIVEMLRGQHSSDYVAQADRLALALDAATVAVVPRSGRTIGLELHDTDPLADPFPLDPAAVEAAAVPMILGRGVEGAVLRHALAAPAHIAVQGQNGSGKSVFAYCLLAQAAHAPDVLVTGSDITGLLLGRARDGTRHRDWQEAGTGSIAVHAELLERLVDEMDRRLTDMPPRVDKLDPGPDAPLVLVVLEEYPGLLRAAASEPPPDKVNGKAPPTVLARIKSATLRLLSEGRKVAFRVVMLAQRAEAESMGGGYARDQFALSVSFRVPADSLAMLHGDAARPPRRGPPARRPRHRDRVRTRPAPHPRIRTPYVGDYAAFCDRVAPRDA